MAGRRVGAALLALLVLVGCKKETPIERVNAEVEAPSQDEPIRLVVGVDKSDVQLGDDVVFHVKLTNEGKHRVTVNVPRLDLRSFSLRVRREGAPIAVVTRNRADIDFRVQQFVPLPGATKELGPGESVEADVSTVAVEVGTLAYTPSYVYQGASAPLVGATMEVKVSPADASKPRLGVELDTSEGVYSAAFRPDVAFNTVESFAALVKRGFYNGLKLHRIMQGFMAQGGDPKGTGEGGPGYYIPFEGSTSPKLQHRRGVMSMARTGLPTIGRDTAGSQFFILFATRTDLDKGGYTTFAEMVDGEETLKKLERVPVKMSSQGEPSEPVAPVIVKRATLISVK